MRTHELVYVSLCLHFDLLLSFFLFLLLLFSFLIKKKVNKSQLYFDDNMTMQSHMLSRLKM